MQTNSSLTAGNTANRKLFLNRFSNYASGICQVQKTLFHAARVLALVIFVAGFTEATTVSVTATGLPPGLTLSLNGHFGCDTTPSNSFTFVEHQSTHPEPVYGPGGIIVGIQLVVDTFYVGSGNFELPTAAQNKCVSFKRDEFTYQYVVIGSPNRFVPGFKKLPTSGQTHWTETFEARTLSLVDDGTGAVPVTANGSLFYNWKVAYGDIFGGGSVVTPSLAVTEVSTQSGVTINTTRVKMSLSDENTVCVAVGSTTVCGDIGNGLLTNSYVTVDLNRVEVSNGPDKKVVNWVFRIQLSGPIPTPWGGTYWSYSGLAPGNYTVVATANDRDPGRYLVDGTLEVIDLLPWKKLSIPVNFSY